MPIQKIQEYNSQFLLSQVSLLASSARDYRRLFTSQGTGPIATLFSHVPRCKAGEGRDFSLSILEESRNIVKQDMRLFVAAIL